MSQNTVIEYPTGLSSIPYASFLQIEKYAYSEAQKKVADQQNDALGSVSRSSIGGIVNTAADGFANVYGSGDASKNNKFTTYKTEERNWLGVKKNVDISDANVDKNTVVEVNGEKITVGQLLKKKQELKDRKSKGLMSTRCMLPLHNEFQYCLLYTSPSPRD